MTYRKSILVMVVSFSLLTGAGWCRARTWTDGSGRFTIEGELAEVSADGASVTLRSADGEKITLKLEQLSEADRKFVRQQSDAGANRGSDDNPFLSGKERVGAAGEAPKVSHRRALLIGVNEYKNFRKLNYCGTNVQALGKRLISAGFDADKVIVVHDEATRSLQPDKEKIVNQITLLLESAEANDLVLLAFSGHGVRLNGKSYLVPYEAELPKSSLKSDVNESIKTLIALDWIYEKLQASRASMKLFLVDACQNRLLEGDQRSAGSDVTLGEIGQSLETAPKGVLLLTACAAGEVSHESETLKHGVYSYFLLEALDGKADYNHDGIISLKEANLYASSHTEQFVRTHFNKTQRPSFKGELQGDVPLAECLEMDRITVPDDIDNLEVALRRASVGATITVKPGVYRYAEPLRISREVTIVGATGDARDVVLEGTDAEAIVMEADRARIQSVSIRNQASPTRRVSAVLITQGKLEMLKCDITSQNGSCMSLKGEKANPTVSFCNIHDAGWRGVIMCDNSKGVFENCDISGNAAAGIVVFTGGNPVVKDCKIHDGKQGGIFVQKDGKGHFENCDISNNALAGIEVQEGGNLSVNDCKIHDGKQSGIFVQKDGIGHFENCDISNNAFAGIEVRGSGNPVVKNCNIHNGKQNGILVYQNGNGHFENCDISGNAFLGIEVREGGNPIVKDCKIHDGKQGGVLVGKDGTGHFENCDISSNALAGIEVREAGNPVLKDCKIHDGKKGGVFVYQNGNGHFENCDISGNALSGIEVREGGNPIVKDCKIHDGKQGGVFVFKNANGHFENCDIWSNASSGIDVQDGGSDQTEAGSNQTENVKQEAHSV